MIKLVTTVLVLFLLSANCSGQEQYFTLEIDSNFRIRGLSPTFDSFPYKRINARVDWDIDSQYRSVEKCLLENLTQKQLNELSEMKTCHASLYIDIDRLAHYGTFLIDSLTSGNVNQELFLTSIMH
jgi:hypothetical protein